MAGWAQVLPHILERASSLYSVGIGIEQHQVAGFLDQQQFVVAGAGERGMIGADLGARPKNLAGGGFDAVQGDV